MRKEQLQCVEVGNTMQSIGRREGGQSQDFKKGQRERKRPSGKEVLEKQSQGRRQMRGVECPGNQEWGMSRRCSTTSAEEDRAWKSTQGLTVGRLVETRFYYTNGDSPSGLYLLLVFNSIIAVRKSRGCFPLTFHFFLHFFNP